jgi:hypothetical protein
MMAQYKVTSDLLSGHKHGDLVTEQDLPGANIAALIEAGHLGAVGVPKNKAEKDKE